MASWEADGDEERWLGGRACVWGLRRSRGAGKWPGPWPPCDALAAHGATELSLSPDGESAAYSLGSLARES